MPFASAPERSLPPADLDRIEQAAAFVRSNDTASALDVLLPDLTAEERQALAGTLRLAHTALLVFPRTLVGLAEELAERGLHAAELTPSVVVRGRLARRHGRPAGALPVGILRASVPDTPGGRGEIEVFALEVPDGSDLVALAAAERATGDEAHIAFEVVAPTPVVLHGLTALLLDRAGAHADSGGHNPHENSTVLYFRVGEHRIELYVPGRHPELLATHLRRSTPRRPPAVGDGDASKSSGAVGDASKSSGAVGDAPKSLGVLGDASKSLGALGHASQSPTALGHAPQSPGVLGHAPQSPGVLRHAPQSPTALGHAPAARDRPRDRLLHLMTGAWTTQAIAVAAELRLADHLDARPGAGLTLLAELTGCHADSLGRLLRHLAGLGLVAADPDGSYHLTELGEPLRTGAADSFQPLALLYGGPFYRSFGELAHSVRTGEEAFAKVFGEHHFPHFARHPELADLFDRAMAASAPMFAPVAGLVDLSAHRVVVDVAGGNGELLGRLLRAAPHLRGVLLERPHAVEAAEKAFAEAGLADRCRFMAGDFTSEVPDGGDLYVLSRVLHDWDDERCLTILRRCAQAMAPGSELLLIERLLPTDARLSLAVAWDLHMLCNVGGRERTSDHYRRLLDEAGFDFTSCHELPLQAALLRFRRR
ncbi:methyltransferase [Streptomyces griseorubiginosus]|uniref:Multifunctional cyclase-dehydratase-3-O-methyl transferase TcmN n=1 Tax=Streptomyces griseorubiginosus TaxID=67304 RepID=A0AAI8PQ86_9ACTN|nr:methyltransferase [Streptomyces griseorubiginosus]AYC41089.1 Multifunctional cyclase-dehydratase-3-O-methyl transferase TcmN [Streptomyces griseorubiginosus]